MNACHTALSLLREGKTDEALARLQRVCERPADADTYGRGARAICASDEIEIDDRPCFSEGEGGCWVSAWVWMPAPDHEEE